MLLTKRMSTINPTAKSLLNMVFKLSFGNFEFTAIERMALRETYDYLATDKIPEAKVAAAQTGLSAKILKTILGGVKSVNMEK